MNDNKRDKFRVAVADLSSRAESALAAWNQQVRDRTAPSTGPSANTEAERIIAQDKLRMQLAELEKETAVVQREYHAKAASLAQLDERAMVAQRHSDVVAATEALEAHRRQSGELHDLVSELAILNALAQACRDVLHGPGH